MLSSAIRLRHLTVFAEVARLGNIARAADAMHVSQPAVTKTIKELERLLGTALLARAGRGIRMTAEGEIFLQHATAALSALRSGVGAVSSGSAEFAPPLRVGALPTVSSRIMPLAIQIFLGEAAAARVEIATGDNDRLIEQLRLGELDLVVGRLAAPDRMSGLTFEHLYSEKVVFVVRAGHPLLALKPFRIDELRAFPLVMPTRRSIIRHPVEQFLIARGLQGVKSRIETVSDSFGRAFVSMTDAVWIISEGVVDAEIREGRLMKLPIDSDDTQGPVGLTRIADAAATPHMTSLMQAIRRAVQERTNS